MSVSSDEYNVHPRHNTPSSNIKNESPFYSTNRNDRLVYNVQLQQNGFRKHRNRNVNKRSNNCFVKAFQWYTQDHKPRPKTNSRNVNTDVSAFAAWLDTKYDEFLHESPRDPNVCSSSIKMIRTSTMIGEKFTNESICGTHNTHKKESRLRSPWRKRRRAANKEASELREPSCKSCEFIMEPKNLSCPASNCCVTNRKCTHKDSKTSTSSQITELTFIKSQEQILSQGDSNVQKCDTTVLQPSKTNLQSNKKKKSLNGSYTPLTVECQCPEKLIVKKEANTQYDILNETVAPVQSRQVSVEKGVKCLCAKWEPERIDSKKSCTPCPCSDKCIIRYDKACQYESDTGAPPCRTSYDTCCAYKMSKESRNEQLDGLAVATTSKFSKIHKQIIVKQKEICFANDAMQTSDHSIRLENPYPMFMKVICADKLHGNECKYLNHSYNCQCR